MSDVELSLFGLYSFDASAFINGRRSLYLPTSFGAIWDGIAVLANQGIVRAVDEVRWELARKRDDTYAWAKSVKACFHRCTRTFRSRPAQYSPNTRSCWVSAGVGTATPQTRSWSRWSWPAAAPVVTQEEPRDVNKPRIPDVCDAMNVPWMTLPQFVDDQGWRITLG